jgi:hypothetical protein
MTERKFQRKTNRKPIRKLFLIVCEGKETEPNYFEFFRTIGHQLGTANIEIIPKAAVGITVVKEAQRRKNEAFDQIWCVFDRDLKAENNNQQNFNQAIQTAIDNDLYLAVSNDSFELWYLLHYEYYESKTHRSMLNKILKTRLGDKYQKNAPDMYAKLLDKQKQAIKFAKKLWSSYDQHINDETLKYNQNPSTTVYQLVEALNQIIFDPLKRIIKDLLTYHNANNQKELLSYREQLKKSVVSPELRKHLNGNLLLIYEYAIDELKNEGDTHKYPESCPYTLEQVLDLKWFPKQFQD